jgi:hypothetical protein
VRMGERREDSGMGINPYRQDRQDLLKHEIQIVWEENPEDFDYVREIVGTYPPPPADKEVERRRPPGGLLGCGARRPEREGVLGGLVGLLP